MATKTMNSDIDPSAPGEGKDNDQTSEIASLRERLMRALAEIENTRRLGERRAQDAVRRRGGGGISGGGGACTAGKEGVG